MGILSSLHLAARGNRIHAIASAAIAAAVVFTVAPASLVAAAAPTPNQVGVDGSDSALWAKQDAAPFVWYGGRLIAAPAVVSVPNRSGSGTPLYLATGTDHAIWTRTATSGWRHLSTDYTNCIDNPAGVVTFSYSAGPWIITVACQGADHAIWSGQASISGDALPPTVNGWVSLGGTAVAGPAVAPKPPCVHAGGSCGQEADNVYFADGTDGHVWTRTLSTGWQQMPWMCIGHPAAATAVFLDLRASIAESSSVFACHGTDNAIWISRNFGSGWSATMSLGGVAVDGPGLAVGPESATVFVQGVDFAQGLSGAVWERSIPHHGSVPSAWSSDGGAAQHGAGAAALLDPLYQP